MSDNRHGQALASTVTAESFPLRKPHSGHVALQQSLERIVNEAAPVIRRRLQQKGVSSEELEDLHLETLERMTAAISRRCRSDEERAYPVDDPKRYALAVADTVFDDHLRRTRPNWCRLKRRVLYLLDNTHAKKLFARWKHRTAWIAGFTRWQQHPFRPSARYHAFCHRRDVFCRQELGDQEPDKLPLPTLMAHLFRWLGTPLELDELTSHIAALQNITDARLLSLEGLAEQTETDVDHWTPPSTEDVAARVMDDMQSETFRAQLWQILRELPLRQRHALLLGMSADELLLTAPFTDIADVLEMPDTSLSELWSELPLADARIAQRLEVTTKQVSNLRKCARERIARNLKL